MTELLPLALLGALFGLDVVCFPQMMFSRPLVAATLTGALVGDALTGALAGATLELIALATLPFGASRYPEWGSAAAVGGAISAALHGDRAGALTIGTLAGLATAWLGGWTLVQLRLWNAALARRMRPALDSGSRRAVIGLQLAGLTSDLVRAALVTAASFAVTFPAARWLVAHWGPSLAVSRGVTTAAACAVCGAAVWTIFHSAPGARWYFAGGVLVGFSILLAR